MGGGEETFGVAGYTTKGRVAHSQVIWRHPDGGALMFESICKDGVDGVIIDWMGDGVICMPIERLRAVLEIVSPETFMQRLQAVRESR